MEWQTYQGANKFIRIGKFYDRSRNVNIETKIIKQRIVKSMLYEVNTNISRTHVTNRFLRVTIIILPIFALLNGCKSEDPGIYDDSRAYYLPFEEGRKSFVAQGYFGSFSHNGYELDFVMPVGSPVLAARSGRVNGVNDSRYRTCPIKKDCYDNYITIEHEDGSYAYYQHIKLDGACVSAGQYVEQGDVIGLSGNVGLSTGPHLHFGVWYGDDAPTFVDVDAKGTGIPKTYSTYTSSNPIEFNFCEDLMNQMADKQGV